MLTHKSGGIIARVEPRCQHRNVLFISLSFFFVFAGFSAGQQYLTVLFERKGEETLALVSLFLLYGTFLLTGAVIARIIPLLGGLKRTLFIGACIYGLFIASIAFESNYLLLFSSVVMGIGAALLWIASGQIVADSSIGETAGRNFAYQVVAQNLGSIAGLMAGSYLLKTASFENMYFSLAAIIGIGALLILFVQPIKQDVRVLPFRFAFLIDPRMLALFPLLFGAYYLAGQSFTAMNSIVIGTIGIGYLALIISILKAGNIAGGLLSGIASDIWSKAGTLLISVGLACIGIFLFAATESFAPIFIGAILMGISMAAVYPVCLSWLKERVKPEEYIYALSVFHVYTNIGAISAILASMRMSASSSFLPGMISLLLAIPGIFLFSKLTAR